MIDRVHFENFKSLKNVTIELGRITVLVGPNGCGKSSVLQGIHLLSQTGIPRKSEGEGKGKEDSEPGAIAAWLRFGSSFAGARDPRRLASRERPTKMLFEMRESGKDQLSLEIAVPKENTSEQESSSSEAGIHFRVCVTGQGSVLTAEIPFESSAIRNHGVTHWRKATLGILNDERVTRFVSVVYLHPDAAEMARTSIPLSENPRMRFDGSGLASTLAWMKGAAEEELAKITEDLARIVPGVRRIRTLRATVSRSRMEKLRIDQQAVWRPVDETVFGDRFEILFEDGTSVPADLLSEGTVLALGLLTKLREPKRPRLVLLDDIDRGLHIEAQARLVQVLRDLLSLDPELQIVCTTHSPYLLDLFKPEEVRVLALDEKRQTHALPLMDHPDFEKWKFGTQTGELWAALGHAWVIKATEETLATEEPRS